MRLLLPLLLADTLATDGIPALPLQAWHAAVSSGDLETTWDQGVFNDLIKAETKRLPKRDQNMFL